jgi:uncharacterized protein (TIGR02231 family)
MVRNLRHQRVLACLGLTLGGGIARASFAADVDTSQPPRVTRAVVYPDRALITRSLEVTCGDQPSAATFRSLPPSLDSTTLQASVTGSDARVEGVSLTERVLKDPYGAEVRALDKQIEDLRTQVEDQQRERQRAESLRLDAESLRTSEADFLVREAAAEKKPDTTRWKEGLDATRVMIDQANQRRLAADAALRDQNRRLAEIEKKRDALAVAAPRHAIDADVLVRCHTGGSARVELSYMQGGVSWKPRYEARADTSTNRIALSVLAEVTQATGEAWHAVDVTLSTAVTRQNARPPQPKRLYLGATPQEETRKVLVRREVDVEHLESRGPTSGKNLGGETAGLEATEQGLSVRLKVPEPVSLRGDGRPARLLVDQVDVPATFSLVCVPKVLPYVFRSGEAANAARYPLLPGRVDLFSGGDYIGSSDMPRVAQGDKLKLSFGIAEGLKVKRTVLGEEMRDPGFLSSTRRFLYAYRIELTSYESKSTEVKLQEHIPVSQLDDVKVLVDPKTTDVYDLAKDDGIVTWKVSLSPGQKRQLELHFAVEIPEKYDSTGL